MHENLILYRLRLIEYSIVAVMESELYNLEEHSNNEMCIVICITIYIME